VRLGVDPGSHLSGWASADDNGTVIGAGHEKNDRLCFPSAVRIDLAIEVPNRLWRGTVADLIALSRGVERVVLLTRPVPRTLKEYAPDEWKNTIPKWTHHSRMWDGLSLAEQRIFADAFKRSPGQISEYITKACTIAAIKKTAPYGAKCTHALDALGILLFDVGRITKHGTHQ